MASSSSQPPRKLAHRKISNRLQLRDIRDLTLHGGVDAQGDLILIPIFCGLGTKGLNPAHYFEQSENFWRDHKLAQCMQQINWTLAERSYYRIYYPSLTVALPLPSAAVIDHILSSEVSDQVTIKTARSQLQRCVKSRQWRLYRTIGQKIPDACAAAQILLTAEERWPGLLTDAFRQQLEVLQELRSAIENAENQRIFSALPGNELTFAWNLSERYRRPQNLLIDSSNWSGFFTYRSAYETDVFTALSEKTSYFSSDQPSPGLASVKQPADGLWGVIADIGASACGDFLRRLEIAQGTGAIWAEGVLLERGWSGLSFQREYAHQFWRSRSFGVVNNLTLIWRQLILYAAKQQGYSAERWPYAQREAVALKRYSAESVVATVLEHLPSRPIASGGILCVRHLSEPNEAFTQDLPSLGRDYSVEIEPALPTPEFAAKKSNNRAKKSVTQKESFICLSELYQNFRKLGVSGVSGFDVEIKLRRLWPTGRLWQTIDFVKTLVALPEIFLCPEILTDGVLKISAVSWDEFAKRGDTLGSLTPNGLAWTKVHDLFFGAAVWLSCPTNSKKSTSYNDPSFNRWPMQVIDAGMHVADVQLAVQFVPVDATSSKSGGSDSLLSNLADGLIQQQKSNHNIDQLIHEVSEGLRFQARPYFEVDGQAVEESDWFKAVKTKSGDYRLHSGHLINASVYLSKTDQFIIRKRVYAKFSQLSLTEIWRTQMQALAAVRGECSPEDYIRQLRLRVAPVLKDLDARTLTAIADGLLATSINDLSTVLRPYQTEGVAWAYLRLRLGFGVCLADEMGLGKTLQAIAILRCLHAGNKRSLVVMPKTLLHNWRRELARFAPNMRVVVYGEQELDDNLDIVLVTYPRLRLDQEKLASIDWDLVLLDEAQAIKNSETRLTEAAIQLVARHRIAITGTPIENRATELWSIVNWLNPGYLGNQFEFNSYSAMARSSEQKLAMLAPLRECLDPFILRRRKSDPKVALGLPEKVYLEQRCDLSEEQSLLYESVIETVLAEDDKNLKPSWRRALFLKAIMHLKQICIHPDLFYGEQADEDIVATLDVSTNVESSKLRAKVLSMIQKSRDTASFASWLERSGKLLALKQMLDSLTLQSRGILIFTQYLAAADVIRRMLSHVVVESVPFIHGSLSASERMSLVDEFNERCHQRHSHEQCPILILSIKAGGTGLNLIGADRVIHFDRWWNPAVEDQATDRVHRIGQDRTVFIHTFTCESTIEDSISKLFVEKRQLAEDLLGAAAAHDVSDYLRDHAAFLDLIDPERVFSRRLTKVDKKRRSKK